MNGKFKYIIVSDRDIEIPIIFSKLLQHKEVAGCRQVVSAGFLQVSRNPVRAFTCYGESVSLRVQSRGNDDAAVIRKDYEFQL